ncbi:glycosyltransferase [Hyalangium versicolor]|uniref:glycosyltransferase n=1 Tax=Hyalangium versicolor TaxID=2861190 RepID=UPI001CCF05EF|nr:glycosyltransferase [Hyalangium versicolor]
MPAKSSSSVTTPRSPPPRQTPFVGRRLRVVHVMHGLQLGGLETFVVRLASAGRELGLEPLVLALGDDGPVRDLLSEHEVPCVWLEGLPGLSPGALRRITQELRAFEAHVVHGHDMGPWLNAAAASLLSGGTVPLATFHQTAQPGSKLRPLASVAASLSPALIACGRAVEEEIRGWAPRSARVVTIENGVPLPEPASPRERSALRERLGLPARSIVFGYLGRLHPEKGVETLVDAFAQAFAREQNVHLVLIGTGQLEGALRARNVERVHFLGEVPHGSRLLPAFDVYVQPSLREGRSLALLEAMAAGLPTVTSDIPAIREVHAAGETALLAPPGDARSLAGALRTLAADATQRADLGRKARERSRDHSLDTMVQRYATLYRDVVSRWEC